jgi:2-oxoglutarate ferredoxin oxidoreductase subunit beta
MPSIRKPAPPLVPLERNAEGLTVRDYEGEMSTLCAGCGHDSITAAIVRSLFETSTQPHMVAKLSGIGCSAKTPAYFASQAHGFNSAHGRMAPIATGASAANRDLICIGISGDGDSLSIGLGHLLHTIRRNVHMVYVIENNGVYGLTKGQHSASADVGSVSKRGERNAITPIDPVVLALEQGATFVARSFSGDKAQLVPILEAAMAHKGFALIDVISPCVRFNNEAGSTKSYHYVREHELKDVDTDFVPPEDEITASIPPGGGTTVSMHGGGRLRFSSLPDGYDPTDREAALDYVRHAARDHEIPTGVFFVDETAEDLHELNATPDLPLVDIPFDDLCPGSEALERLQAGFR